MRRPGADEWKQLIEEYERGTLTQKEFVEKHDVSFSTFQYWLYKRSKLAAKFDVNSGQRFLPVQVVASPAPKARLAGPAVIEAMSQNGLLLRFVVGTDTRYLAELVAALG